MTNKVKDKNIRIQTHYFFNDIVNIDPNNIKIEE